MTGMRLIGLNPLLSLLVAVLINGALSYSTLPVCYISHLNYEKHATFSINLSFLNLSNTNDRKYSLIKPQIVVYPGDN